MSTLKEKLLHAQTLFVHVQIPAMPKEIIEINRLFAEQEIPDLAELTRIISQNATLVGEVIRIANAPVFMGTRQQEIINIKDAIQVIGVKRLKNLVTSVGYQMQTGNMGLEEVNEFSFRSALVAAELAQYVDGVSEDQAYLAALFHNAGAMLMAAAFRDYDQIFMQSLSQPYSILALESTRYQTAHTIAGLLVARQWHLNSLLSHVIVLHHQKSLTKIEDDQVRTLVAMIQLANAIVTQVVFPDHQGEEVTTMLASAQTELFVEDSVIQHLIGVLQSEL